jgi:hypothetical protein
MEVDKPSWSLKNTCPDCQQGYPVFYSCTNCGYLTVRCEETGNTFSDPKNLEKGFISFCPNCNYSVDNFELADTMQISKNGFNISEYQ